MLYNIQCLALFYVVLMFWYRIIYVFIFFFCDKDLKYNISHMLHIKYYSYNTV